MGSTYHAIFYHIIFHTKYNRSTIDPAWEKYLYEYIAARVYDYGGILLAIGGVDDHIHLLVKLTPSILVSSFVRKIKVSSSRWVHRTLGIRPFGWQDGYTALSVSKGVVPTTTRYVLNQKVHHRVIGWREELITTLDEAEIEYDPRFIPNSQAG